MKTPAGNSTLAIGGVSSPLDSFEVAESSVLRTNFCAENPAHRQSAKRCTSCQNTLVEIMTNHQRIGIKSNAEAGNNFEISAKVYLEQLLNQSLEKNLSVKIGISEIKKAHRFDLGNESTIIECKTHRWTSGSNIPSAKMTVWNEAMFYFSLAPKSFRKIFFIDRDYSERRKKTLGEYYAETYKHLIPDDVEIWEFDEIKNRHEKIK